MTIFFKGYGWCYYSCTFTSSGSGWENCHPTIATTGDGWTPQLASLLHSCSEVNHVSSLQSIVKKRHVLAPTPSFFFFLLSSVWTPTLLTLNVVMADTSCLSSCEMKMQLRAWNAQDDCTARSITFTGASLCNLSSERWVPHGTLGDQKHGQGIWKWTLYLLTRGCVHDLTVQYIQGKKNLLNRVSTYINMHLLNREQPSVSLGMEVHCEKLTELLRLINKRL